MSIHSGAYRRRENTKASTRENLAEELQPASVRSFAVVAADVAPPRDARPPSRSPSASPAACGSCNSTRSRGATRADGGLAILYGNLATRGCVVKTAGVDESILTFNGPAVVVESQEAAVEAILGGRITRATSS